MSLVYSFIRPAFRGSCSNISREPEFIEIHSSVMVPCIWWFVCNSSIESGVARWCKDVHPYVKHVAMENKKCPFLVHTQMMSFLLQVISAGFEKEWSFGRVWTGCFERKAPTMKTARAIALNRDKSTRRSRLKAEAVHFLVISEATMAALNSVLI